MAESSSLQPEYSKLPDTPPVTVVSSASSSSAQQPKLQLCDIVMKGGITSGIVYPPAVSQLVAGNYQFQNIGGTSVGAMAAAGIAAAEFNRRCNGGSRAGFDYLEQDIQRWLGRDRNLLNLFQPDVRTRPLFELLLALMSAPKPQAQSAGPHESATSVGGQGEPKGSRKGGDPTGKVSSAAAAKTAPNKTWQSISKIGFTWLVSYGPLSWSAALGAIAGLIGCELLPLALFALVDLVNHNFAIALSGLFTVLYIVLGIVGLWLGWHLGNVLGAIAALPGNGYGICTGHSTEGQGKPGIIHRYADTIHRSLPWQHPTSPPLTDWFTATLNRLAGKKFDDPPLTFGDLQGQDVQLKMISSNLSHNLPYVLPEGLHNFIFNQREMERLFPPDVVEYMVKHQPADDASDPKKRPLIPGGMLPDGFFYCPDEQDLPVIVAARMSLSYPMLLSAVPLYTISTNAYNRYQQHPAKLAAPAVPPSGVANTAATGVTGEADPDLQPNWFSDGGICSNFPIKFFDAWLPKWPTFGINLTDLSMTTSALQAEERINPTPVKDVLDEDNAAVFLPPIMGAQDPEWHDLDNSMVQFARAIFGTAQNYSDTMQAGLPSYRERIVQIRLDHSEGGLNLAMPPDVIERVGRKGERAGDVLCQQFDLERHTWVRFLVLMSQLERNVVEMKDVLQDLPFRQRMKDVLQTLIALPGVGQVQQESEWVQVVIEGVEANEQVQGSGSGQVAMPSSKGEQQGKESEFIAVEMQTPNPVQQRQDGELEQTDLQRVVAWLKNYPYSAGKDDRWLMGAMKRTDLLLDFIEGWDIEPKDAKKQPEFFREGEPLPEPVLRVTPEM